MATLTKEQVFSACRELKETNPEFTQADVATITGGSYSKLGPWIKEWKVLDEKLSGLEHLDPVLLSGLNEWCGHLKDTYNKAAEQKILQITEQRDTYVCKLEKTQSDVNQQALEIKELQERGFAQTEQILELQEYLDETKRDLQKSLQKEQSLLRQLEGWEQTNHKWHAKEQILEAKIDKIQQEAKVQLSAEIERISVLYESSETRLLRDIDALRRKESQLLNEISHLKNEILGHVEQGQKYKSAIEQKNLEEKAFKAQIEHLESHIINLKVSSQNLEEQKNSQIELIAELQRKHQALELEISKGQAINETIKHQCEREAHNSNQLREQIAQLTRELGRLEANALERAVKVTEKS